MDLSKLNRKEYYGVYILVLIVVCCLVGVLISRSKPETVPDFAKPLYEHALPEGTTLIQRSSDSGTNEDGTAYSFACLILQSPLTQEELTAFYADTDYPAAREGDQVTLSVLPVEGDSLSVVQSSKLYQEDGGGLWYIYLYSQEQKTKVAAVYTD